MCSINWQLVLEFAKVLAAPSATLLGVVVLSSLGIRAFRKQRGLDRRVGWYEEACVLLDRTAKAFAIAAEFPNPTPEQASEHVEDAMTTSTALGDHLGKAWLYADQAALDETARVGQTMEAVHRPIQDTQSITAAQAAEVVEVCLAASLNIAKGVRAELGLRQVTASK